MHRSFAAKNLAVAAALALATGTGGALWQRRRPSALQQFSTVTAELLQGGGKAALSSRNEAGFAAGNIGRVERPQPNAYTLHLRSDNDDALPPYWRQWFYLRLDDVPVGPKVALRLEGAGQQNYYLPFYSYDDLNWTQFAEAAVSQDEQGSLVMTSAFAHPRLWLARFEPYGYDRLMRFLASLKLRSDTVIESLGKEPGGLGVPLVTIAGAGPKAAKKRVVIHARTHPGEVASSFVLEGLMTYLLGPSELAGRMRSQLIFTILPMLNVGGVVAGNNRVSPEGTNLEGKWYSLPGPRSLGLDPAQTPSEVRLFNAYLAPLLTREGPPTLALNLHASAGDKANPAFFFTHFGPSGHGYSNAEAALYDKQLKFIAALAAAAGPGWTAPASEGGRSFLSAWTPERWWWDHFGPQVTALTIESTYGLAGRSTTRWIQPSDLRAFGAALAVAIARYHGLPLQCPPPGRGKPLASCR